MIVYDLNNIRNLNICAVFFQKQVAWDGLDPSQIDFFDYGVVGDNDLCGIVSSIRRLRRQ